MKKLALIFMMLTAALTSVVAAAAPSSHYDVVAEQEAPVKAELVSGSSAISPGQTFQIGVDLDINPGWHVYYKEPGDSGRATQVMLVSPENFQIVELLWQRPERFEEEGLVTYGYQRHSFLAVTLKAPDDLKPGQSLEIRLNVDWIACDKECVPGNQEISITLPVVAVSAPVQALNAEKFATVGFNGSVADIGKPQTNPQPSGQSTVTTSDKPGFFLALLMAFGGGVLLNLMPCVLPVISLKIFGFVKQAGQSRKKIFGLGVAYSAGTIGTFLLLALAVIAAQFAGYTVGWGFQFQQPLFVVAMIALVTVMSLGLFGVFFVQVSSGNNGLERMAQTEGWAGAFAKGVSATLLSTPCTAPLLGSAMGFAFSQPWWGVLAIFFTVGLGLSSPYLLLSWQPGWLRFLPKPGAWMEHFKEAMGFLMLATGVWLLYVLGQQCGLLAVNATLIFLLVVSACAWAIGRFAGFDSSRKRRWFVWLVALVASGATFWHFVRPSLTANNSGAQVTSSWTANGIHWEPYSQQSLQSNLASGKIVLIDFTADWCLTCKLNEQILNSSSVVSKLVSANVTVLQADWTRGDPEITAALAKYGRSGVPLYVIYSPARPTEPILLPEIITASMVTDAIDRASKP